MSSKKNNGIAIALCLNMLGWNSIAQIVAHVGGGVSWVSRYNVAEVVESMNLANWPSDKLNVPKLRESYSVGGSYQIKLKRVIKIKGNRLRLFECQFVV